MRNKLLQRIKNECDEIKFLTDKIDENTLFIRKSLSVYHLQAGCMKWYWYIDGYCVGSSYGIRELMKSDKLCIYKATFGDYEILPDEK